MAILSTGGSVSGKANVNGNFELEVHVNSNPANVGFFKLAGTDNDKLKMTATGYPAVSIESLDFFDTVDNGVIDTNKWVQSYTSMVIADNVGGFYRINPTNVTTANGYAIFQTIQTFFVTSCLPLHFHFSLQSTIWNLAAHVVAEIGWGTVATNAAPTDGVIIRAIAGSIGLYINNGGSEGAPGSFNSGLPSPNVTDEWVLDIYASTARLYKNGALESSITAPTSLAAATNSNRQPFFIRVYEDATGAAASPTIKLGQISIQQRNANLGLTMPERLIGMGRSAIQGPTTFTQTAQYANSAVPSTATLNNTTSSYATLGGKYLVTGVASANTDFPLFGYQVPAGYQLYVKGIWMSAWISTVLVGGPLVLEWAIGVNSSAQSLATVDAVGPPMTWAPRRMAIGQHGFAAAAAVGTSGTDVVRPLNGICVDGNRWFHVILRMPNGVTSGAISGSIGVDGVFV